MAWRALGVRRAVADSATTGGLVIAMLGVLQGCIPFGDPGPAGISQEVRDRLSFSATSSVETRHVRFVVSAGEGDAHVQANFPIETGGVDDKRPVVLTVVRDRDGVSVNDDFGPDYRPGTTSSLAGNMDVLDCPRSQVCTETFTFTFQRIPADQRETLEFSWSVRARSEYGDVGEFESPPIGAAIEISIIK